MNTVTHTTINDDDLIKFIEDNIICDNVALLSDRSSTEKFVVFSCVSKPDLKQIIVPLPALEQALEALRHHRNTHPHKYL